jgi:hypothetical protein
MKRHRAAALLGGALITLAGVLHAAQAQPPPNTKACSPAVAVQGSTVHCEISALNTSDAVQTFTFNDSLTGPGTIVPNTLTVSPATRVVGGLSACTVTTTSISCPMQFPANASGLIAYDVHVNLAAPPAATITNSFNYGGDEVGNFSITTPAAPTANTKECSPAMAAPGSTVHCQIAPKNTSGATTTFTFNDTLTGPGTIVPGTFTVVDPSLVVGGVSACTVTATSISCPMQFPPNTQGLVAYDVKISSAAAPGATIVNIFNYGSGEQGRFTITTPGCTINGAGNITGTANDDVICGSAGADNITGKGGNDIIYGFGGSDRIAGGDGKDTISGGDGNDTLAGDSGNDTIIGGAGTDTVAGASGTDNCSGESVAGCEGPAPAA